MREKVTSRDSSSIIEPPLHVEREFFDLYSVVPAFNKTLSKANEAVDLFKASKLQLEKDLKAELTIAESGKDAERAGNTIAIYHSLLALIHWLYPNYERYDRARNASIMYHHAKEATRYSQTPFSESYILGLFIQLRVLPFLIMSNKPFEKQLSKVQGKAQLLILTLDSNPYENNQVKQGGIEELDALQTNRFRGLLHEALGFSYWQLKRDSDTALKHIERSVTTLLGPSAGTSFKTAPYSSKDTEASGYFYNAFASVAFWDLGHCHEGMAENFEGDESARLIIEARRDYEKAYALAKKTRWDNYKGLSAYMIASTYELESQQETDKKTIVNLLMKAVRTGEEALHWLSLWSTYDSDFLAGSWIAEYYGRLADYSEPRQKRSYMLHSLKLTKRAEDLISKHESKSGGKLLSASRMGDIYLRNATYYKQIALSEKSTRVSWSRLSATKAKKEKNFSTDELKKSLDYVLRSRAFYKEDRSPKKIWDASKLEAEVCYALLKSDILEGEKRRLRAIGKKACEDAGHIAKKNEWNERVAEANWNAALILDIEGDHAGSAKCYLRAHESYEKAKAASEQGTKVYQEYSDYMLGWNRIELAKLSHSASEFEKASDLYHRAANLISKTKDWSKVSPLFMAESLIEKAEGKALLEEQPDTTIELFEEAISNLARFSEESKKESAVEQLDLSPLARQLIVFCRARIILEKSKEAYRVGDFGRSISGLSGAESMFEDLASNQIISDSLRSNELLSMAALCKALGAFQKAQVKGDGELYLEARKIFGRAAEESKSRTLRPLLTGLASFASFLFYSNQVEESLDTKLDFQQLNECHKALQNAESNFRRLGNRSFLNMLKASKHILDATIKMSAAEREVDRMDVKAKLYADAQRSLSQASKYYKVMGSSKRLKEALKMISAVRNHQRLIPLARDIIAEVASSQIIYAAIASSPVMEQSPYASSTQGSYVSLDCELEKSYGQTGEKSKISFSISNLGREGITLVRIDELVPEGFEILECPLGSLSGSTLKLNIKLGAGASKAFTINYVPKSSGEFVWHPSLIFLDASRSFKIAKSRIAKAVVETSDQEDFAMLLQTKAGLEVALNALKEQKEKVNAGKTESEQSQTKLEDEIFAVKEKISHIEEKFLRTKNEYQSLVSEQEKVRFDIESVAKRSSIAAQELEGSDEYTNLKAEESLLEARIQRRRSLLEQAQLL